LDEDEIYEKSVRMALGLINQVEERVIHVAGSLETLSEHLREGWRVKPGCSFPALEGGSVVTIIKFNSKKEGEEED